MMPRDPGNLRFDAFRLDDTCGALLDAEGAELRLRPKVSALLQYLLENPGRLLGRKELLDVLWPGIMVTDDSLTQCVGDLRQAFGNRAPHVLRTVPKRGYMLIAEVFREDVPLQKPGSASGVTPAATPSRNIAALRRETMTVHRFGTPDGDQACILLADGLASDLTAILTCLEGLRILPATDATSGDGYHVRGEVRALGKKLRVTVRLEEAATGIALWAERLEQHRDRPPELPSVDLTTLIVHLGQQVDRHCLAAARQKTGAALSARELHLIGRDHHQRGTEADTRVAKKTFELAMARDPDYAQAFAWQAYTVSRAITHCWGSPGEQAARDEALRLARRAVQIDPTSPLCLSHLAFALMLHQQWDDAVATARAALQSDRPAFTAARNPCCEVLSHAGHPEEAAMVARGTLVLDPLCPPTTRALLGRALLLAGNVEGAVQALQWCASRLPDYAPTFDSLVVASTEAGRLPEALAAWGELSRLMPGWVPCNHTGPWYFRRPEDVDRFQAAHRRVAELAGVLLAKSEVPSAAVPAFGAGQAVSTTRSAARMIGEGVVGLRQDTLEIHELRTATDDAVASRAIPAV